MQKRFSIFPGGLPDLAMLILRFTLGMTAIVQGIALLSDYKQTSFSILAIALLVTLCGAFLIIGLMSPIAALVVFFGSLVTATSVISAAKLKNNDNLWVNTLTGYA